MTLSGSRWVCTMMASGYAPTSWSRCQRWAGDLSNHCVRRVPRLQVLQEQPVPAVGRSEIGVVEEPAVVGGQPELDREDHAAEVARGDADALLGERRPHGVEAGEAGDERVGQGQGGIDLGDAWIGVVGGGLRRRQRSIDLPGERGPQRAIEGQQVVEDGGAGAGLAHDDDGLVGSRPRRSRDGDDAMRRCPNGWPAGSRSRRRRSRRRARGASLRIGDPRARRSRPSCHVGSPKSSPSTRSTASATRRSRWRRSSLMSAPAQGSARIGLSDEEGSVTLGDLTSTQRQQLGQQPEPRTQTGDLGEDALRTIDHPT